MIKIFLIPCIPKLEKSDTFARIEARFAIESIQPHQLHESSHYLPYPA